MFATVLTDCQDDNALGRVTTRLGSLLDTGVHTVRVSSDLNGRAELEAAGNLVDILDAAEGRPGVVLVNVAPRSGAAHDAWSNGTPFGYFRYGDTLVVSTIDGVVLSLVKKLGLVDEIQVIDLEKVATDELDHADLAYSPEHIIGSQFRSFDFLPRVAAHLYRHGTVTAMPRSLADTPDVANTVWWIDNFGNCKTTLVADDIVHRPDEPIETTFGPIGYRYALRNVPNGEVGIVVGSSGIGTTRFLELVLQGGSAAEKLGIGVCDTVLS
ncbi:MAG: SAM hydroxide adenosyltransferase [Candidatus Paceibacterota bacterium]